MENNELTHYGVVGMRWGIRRAKKNGTTYTYKSYGQKKYDKKIKKYEDEGLTDTTKYKKAKDKQQLYKERDKNRQQYAENASVGKQILKTMLMGPFGNGSYSRLRSSGYGKLGSAFIATMSYGDPVPLLTKYMENVATKNQMSRNK